jgi:hypothetical protein
MSNSVKIKRDLREIVHDELFMEDRIAKILENGSQTIPEISEALGCPSNEVVIWLFAMRRYGQVEAVGRPDIDGYYQYTLVKTAG